MLRVRVPTFLREKVIAVERMISQLLHPEPVDSSDKTTQFMLFQQVATFSTRLSVQKAHGSTQLALRHHNPRWQTA